MTLASGARLGGYEIVGPLGRGGMGEVYRARDTELGREVALKVLPDELASDSERLARFEREAKLLAGVNHPNVATLYGVERSDGHPVLVMELVEGETLAERIASKPLSPEEASGIFTQIAEGLGAAHDQGVVHRDLKPANIKITPEGRVKILDFGLAKSADADESPSQDISGSPTRTKGTAMGVILGTAPYMSPEQARGAEVDKRTDIWAFGCCLFESLTGVKAFAGQTVTDTLAAIVKMEPAWEALPAETPETVKLLLRQCLEKNPSRRARDAWDLRILLQAKLGGAASAHAPVKRQVTVLPMAAAVAVGGLLVWIATTFLADEPRPLAKLEIDLGEEGLSQNTLERPIAISADGETIVYSTQLGDTSQLVARRLDEFEPRALPDTKGGRQPFFSPDGEWVGFIDARGRAVKTSLRGGGQFVIAEGRVEQAAWTDDGRVLLSSRVRVSSVPDDGGEPQEFELDESEIEFRARYSFAEPLPAGAGFLFNTLSDDDEPTSRVAVYSSESKAWRILESLGEGGGAVYLETGHLVFAQRGTLMAAPFDLGTLNVTVPATPVLEGVRSNEGNGMENPFYAVSEAGHLVYIPGPTSQQLELVWVDRLGRETPTGAEPGSYEYIKLSPDGSRLAYVNHDNDHRLWIYDIGRQTHRSLRTVARGILWTPDGRSLVFGGDPIQELRADGSSAATRLDNPIIGMASDWAPDGGLLIVRTDGSNLDLVLRSKDGEIVPVAESRFQENHATISPNGRYLAYVSDESGTEQVYVKPFPALDRQWLISRDGGREPRWAPDGTELYYRYDGGVLSVAVEYQPEFRASVPTVLFEGDYVLRPGSTGPYNYDISPDGERFLMIREEPPLRQIRVVLNWLDELERLVPVR